MRQLTRKVLGPPLCAFKAPQKNEFKGKCSRIFFFFSILNKERKQKKYKTKNSNEYSPSFINILRQRTPVRPIRDAAWGLCNVLFFLNLKKIFFRKFYLVDRNSWEMFRDVFLQKKNRSVVWLCAWFTCRVVFAASYIESIGLCFFFGRFFWLVDDS